MEIQKLHRVLNHKGVRNMEFAFRNAGRLDSQIGKLIKEVVEGLLMIKLDFFVQLMYLLALNFILFSFSSRFCSECSLFFSFSYSSSSSFFIILALILALALDFLLLRFSFSFSSRFLILLSFSFSFSSKQIFCFSFSSKQIFCFSFSFSSQQIFSFSFSLCSRFL